jgi:hypothetical protein
MPHGRHYRAEGLSRVPNTALSSLAALSQFAQSMIGPA